MKQTAQQRTVKKSILLIISLLCLGDPSALLAGTIINPGTVDTTFRPTFSGGTSQTVRKIRVLPTGEVVIAGDFASTKDFPDYGLAILKPDGSVDRRVICYVPGILDFDVSPNGRIFYSARATLVLATSARLPPRFGYYDFPSGAHKEIVYKDDVYLKSIFAQSNGMVVVSGTFDTKSFGPWHILRFTSNLAPDPSWNSGVLGAFCSMVESSDGSLYAGGGFEVGDKGSQIIKLHPDGTLDQSFKPITFQVRANLADPQPVQRLSLDDQGHLLVCGAFDLINETNPATGIVRLRSDGTVSEIPLLPPYKPGSNYYPSLPVRDIFSQKGGRLFVAVGTGIYSFGAPDWQAPIAVQDASPGGALYFCALAAAADGGIYAAGDFSRVNSVPSTNIVRLWAENVRSRLTIDKAIDGARFTLAAPLGGIIETETSTDLKNWSVDQRFENFAGSYTNLIKTELSRKFFRSRQIE